MRQRTSSFTSMNNTCDRERAVLPQPRLLPFQPLFAAIADILSENMKYKRRNICAYTLATGKGNCHQETSHWYIKKQGTVTKKPLVQQRMVTRNISMDRDFHVNKASYIRPTSLACSPDSIVWVQLSMLSPYCTCWTDLFSSTEFILLCLQAIWQLPPHQLLLRHFSFSA